MVEYSNTRCNDEVKYEDFVEYVRTGTPSPSRSPDRSPTRLEAKAGMRKTSGDAWQGELPKVQRQRSESEDGFGDDEEYEANERDKIKKVGDGRRHSFSAGGASEEDIKNYKPPFYPK